MSVDDRCVNVGTRCETTCAVRTNPKFWHLPWLAGLPIDGDLGSTGDRETARVMRFNQFIGRYPNVTTHKSQKTNLSTRLN
eukprot:174325-Prorocentrum_minimum.AAC.2